MSAENEPAPIVPTLDDLAAEHGWTIEDPQVRHERSPENFWLPDDDLRATIGPGSQVRLLLWFIDEDAPDHLVPQCERMWVLVEARDGDVIRGRLASPPGSARATLEMGELIQFRPTDAIDVLGPETTGTSTASSKRSLMVTTPSRSGSERIHTNFSPAHEKA